MKKIFYNFVVIFLYILSVSILLHLLKIRLNPKYYLETNSRLIILFSVCLFIYLSGYIIVYKLNYNKKILKINLIIYTLIYTFIIFSLTLFEEIFGRNGLNFIIWNKDLFNHYIENKFNIIPFKTIFSFIKGYNNGFVSYHNFFVNITGNILAFMPYGIFLPLLFKKMKNYLYFLLVMFIFVFSIETLQFLTMSGSCDIDDIIMNILGASIAYFICKIKFIDKFIHKLFLFE